MQSKTASTAAAANPRWWAGLPLGLLLGVVLLVLSYGRILGDTQTEGFRSKILDAMFVGDIWGSKLFWNIVGFVAALLLIHLLFGIVVWALGRATRAAWPAAKVSLNQAVFVWFLLLTIALLANNAAAFPRSSLGGPYALVMMKQLGGVMLGRWIAFAVLGFAALMVARVCVLRFRQGARPGLRSALAATAVLAFFAVPWLGSLKAPPPRLSDKPNIILIGIDSLRHDAIARSSSPGVAPNIEKFLRGSMEFPNAITPLARTFPSMMSILTGRHPHQTGAIMNLLPRDMVREGDTLGRMLSRSGYYTAYAMDEVRFANIDTSYGFDQTVTPPIGATEFLLSLFADTPLMNPLVNTTPGRWLFPHIHANRGAATTYDPDAFIARIEHELPWQQPLFLTSHLTLPHWPYVWADAPAPDRKEDKTKVRWPKYYLDVLKRTDAQFVTLMNVLERKGVLGNALVIVYSDHGEAFGNPRESLVPEDYPMLQQMNAVPRWGHGNSVLSPHQYRVVLGIRGFGKLAHISGTGDANVPVSVLDIAPTVAELAGAKPEKPFDGLSLLPVLEARAGAVQPFAGRVRFTETEYAPPLTLTGDGKLSTSQLLQAANIYSVNTATDRLEVKREQTPTLLNIRQFAAIGENLLLAALPNDKPNEPSHRFLVVDLRGGFPRRLEGSPPADAPAELQSLWSEIHAKFGTWLPPVLHQSDGARVAAGTVAGPQQTVTHNVTK